MLLRTMLCWSPPLADHPPKRSWRRLSPRVASDRRLPGDQTPGGAALLPEPFPSFPALLCQVRPEEPRAASALCQP